MSISHSIRLMLNLKDPNIHFDENCVSEEQVQQTLALVYAGSLTASTPSICPLANVENSIVKHGSKTALIKLPRVSNHLTMLRLKKQRYLCRSCKHTFSLQSEITEPKHSISTNTFHASILDMKKKMSIKDIAERYDISHTTLNNWLHALHDRFITPKTFLPLYRRCHRSCD